MASPRTHRIPSARETSPSSLAIRNVVVAGHRTSVRLEPLMWQALREIAGWRGISLNALITAIAEARDASSLTAAIRVYIVDFYRSAAAGPPERPVVPV